jgi:hypothetical protein
MMSERIKQAPWHLEEHLKANTAIILFLTGSKRSWKVYNMREQTFYFVDTYTRIIPVPSVAHYCILFSCKNHRSLQSIYHLPDVFPSITIAWTSVFKGAILHLFSNSRTKCDSVPSSWKLLVGLTSVFFLKAVGPYSGIYVFNGHPWKYFENLCWDNTFLVTASVV